MDTNKPNIELRKKIIEDEVLILPNKRIKRLHAKTLLKAEKYYEMILEALAGKQVWQILEALTAIQEEIKSRKENLTPDIKKLLDTLDERYSRNP
jgi:hypothetical protein